MARSPKVVTANAQSPKPVTTSIVEPEVSVTPPKAAAPGFVRRKPARSPMLMVNKIVSTSAPHMSREVEEGEKNPTTSTPADANKKIKPSGMVPVVPGSTGGAAAYPDPGPSGKVTTRPAPGGGTTVSVPITSAKGPTIPKGFPFK